MVERAQSRSKRWGFIGGIIGCSLLVLLLVVNKLSIVITGRTYPTAVDPIAVKADTDSVQRGAHLVRAVLGCRECHGPDLGGQTLVDTTFFGTLTAPNLTGGQASETDLQRAIRLGVRSDGRALWLMPARAYAHLTDADVAAVIAYLRSVPPVTRQLPASRLGLWGRALVGTGHLQLIEAEEAAQIGPTPPQSSFGVDGSYLVHIARCHACHGRNLEGGAETPSLASGSEFRTQWQQDDFVHALRTGLRPDGSILSDSMPWKNVYAAMTDAELRALWQYLQAR